MPIKLKLQHQFDIDVSGRQVIWCPVVVVVDVFHPVVGNHVGDVQQVEDIHAHVHVLDITQWVALAEAAALVNQLLAEPDVDAAVRRLIAVWAVEVGVVRVDGKSRAEIQGHVDTPSGSKGDVVLEKERETEQLV